VELRELVSGEVESVQANTTVIDAAGQMQRAGVGSLAVLDDDELSGIFTERDVLQLVASGADPVSETVAGWMTMYPDSFLPDMDVTEAAGGRLSPSPGGGGRPSHRHGLDQGHPLGVDR
jgi:CBS domain-containing protein